MALCKAKGAVPGQPLDIDGSPPSALASPAPALEAAIVPHLGIVFLDRNIHGDWVLTNTSTLEYLNLGHEHEWCIDFDDEGFACVMNPGDDLSDPQFVEDLMSMALYEGETGQQIMVSTSGPRQGQRLNLNEYKDRFVESDAMIQLGPCKADRALDLAIWKWPRNAAKVLVSLKTVYKALGFNQFNGESWRWIANTKSTWVSTFAKYKMQDHFQGSSHCSKPSAENGAKGILPFLSVTLHGLLLLCSRWSSSSERLGGLACADHRASSRYLMESLVRLSFAGGPHEWPLDLSKTWVNQWPRPSVFANMATLQVNSEGVLDYSDIERVARSQGVHSFAHKLFHKIFGSLG